MTPHVLVARLDNLGDVLLSGPAVRAIAAQSRWVTFLAGPRGAAAARMLPGADAVVGFAAPWIGDDAPPIEPKAIDDLVARVRSWRIDRAFVFTSSHQSALPLALVLRLAGVSWIAAVSRDHPGSLLDLRLAPPGDVHEVEQMLRVAEAGGFPLPAGDDGRLAVRMRAAVPPAAGRYVVVHPGASVPARALPLAPARELVARLVGAGWAVAVTGNQADHGRAEAIAGAAPGPLRSRVRVLTGTTDLESLAAVLRGARVVVAGNTGAAHLAAAVGTPVVSVFAPVVPVARWRPWGVPTRVLGDQDVSCAGCRSRACPFAEQPCLRPATGDALFEAVEELVGACDGAGGRRLAG
jgi:ADP-heptose:LPS heptosyltransferase